jgi:hypothetical protein
MDSTFHNAYENKAKQIFNIAFKRLPSATELERMVKMLKRGGGFFVGQAVDKELLDKVDAPQEGSGVKDSEGDVGKGDNSLNETA